jgi:hypothetical protein
MCVQLKVAIDSGNRRAMKVRPAGDRRLSYAIAAALMTRGLTQRSTLRFKRRDYD